MAEITNHGGHKLFDTDDDTYTVLSIDPDAPVDPTTVTPVISHEIKEKVINENNDRHISESSEQQPEK
jgi:hypothetical protein